MRPEERFADLRERWERRAVEKGSSPAGVLYRGLSPALNEHLHRFHVARLRERFLPLLPRGARVLDLGCGYGRIGRVIADERPDIELVGADFAMPYCRAYRKALGAATVCAPIARLPFAPACFDGIVSVTVLMYVPEPEREVAVARLLGLLRAGGVALVVEPGAEMLALMSLLRPAAARHTTGGSGFRTAAFSRQLGTGASERIDAGGIPAFTLALPLLVALDRLPGAQRRLLRALAALDERTAHPWRLSLQHWAVVRRRAAAPA